MAGNVALIHSFYSNASPSGENIAVEMQMQALRQAGYRVTLIAQYTDALQLRPAYRPITAFTVATGSGVDPLQRIIDSAPDIVHVHNLFPNFGTRWLDQWDGPIVATIHNYRHVCASGMLARNGVDCHKCLNKTFPWPGLVNRCYRKSLIATAPVTLALTGGLRRDPLFRRSDRLCFLTQESLNQHLQGGLRRSGRQAILPNFVEPLAASVPSVPDDAPWLFAGRFTHQKGVLPLLEAWPPETPLMVVGGGPLKDAVRSRCTGRIVLAGQLPRQQLLRILPDVKGIVFPSLSAEALPTIYLEGLAAALPVVARRGTAVASDVTEFGTGLTFAYFDEIPSVLSRVEVNWSQYAEQSLARYRQRFSPEVWLTNVSAVYAAAQAERSTK